MKARFAVFFGTVAVAFFAVTAPWWVRNVVRYGNPVFPAGIPLIGRGIFEADFGGKDASFVPHRAAWLVYPLIEKHSSQSGFGALVAVSVVPGFLFALARGRRRPMLLYNVMTVITVPAWWLFTRHEPRFLLFIFGLSVAFLPWSLLAIPRRQRRLGGVLVVGAALFSALTTMDQGLVPLALQPHSRNAFYDTVWGVDPMIASLPEEEGLLQHTGFAPYSYPGHYPLLGARLKRIVIPVDTDASADAIIATMLNARLRYAYVTASPEAQKIVESKYDRSRFEIVHQSVVRQGWIKGVQRYLYRLKDLGPMVGRPVGR